MFRHRLDLDRRQADRGRREVERFVKPEVGIRRQFGQLFFFSRVEAVRRLFRQEVKQYFHNPIYHPENGTVLLPTLPGLGMVLDESRIESREVVSYA